MKVEIKRVSNGYVVVFEGATVKTLVFANIESALTKIREVFNEE